MSEIMTLEGLDGLDANLTSVLGKGLIGEMARDPRTRAWLKKRGYDVAKSAIKKATAPSEKAPAFVEMIEPLIDPILEGMAQAVKEYVTPLLIKASLIVAGGGVLVGWLVGKAHARQG